MKLPNSMSEIKKVGYTKTQKERMIDENMEAIDDFNSLINLYKQKLANEKTKL